MLKISLDFELAEDNVAQASADGLQPIEEHVRQQAPQLLMMSLRTEIEGMGDNILSHDQSRVQLHDELIAKLGTLTGIAIDTAVDSYRQMQLKLRCGSASTIPHSLLDESLSASQASVIETPPDFESSPQPSREIQSFMWENSSLNNHEDDMPSYFFGSAIDVTNEASSSNQNLHGQMSTFDYSAFRYDPNLDENLLY